MKKLIALLLAIIMCLSLTACGKSDAVKNLEDMIDSFGEITADNIWNMQDIKLAYRSLSEKEQKQVKNYKSFMEACDAYWKTCVVGTWHPVEINMVDPEKSINPQYSITLNADMTVKAVNGPFSSGLNGTWDVKDGNILINGISEINAEYYSDQGNGFTFFIDRIDDTFCIFFGNENERAYGRAYDRVYLRAEDYNKCIENSLFVINCNEDDLSKYIDFTSFTYKVLDQFGDPTGVARTTICLKSLLYDQGWTYVGVSEDFSMEILYPEYTSTYYNTNGEIINTVNWPEGAYTFSSFPFNYCNKPCDLELISDEHIANDIALDSLSFGRAKGKIYFINSEYVADIRRSENGLDREIIIDEQSPCGVHGGVLFGGVWEEENQSY